MTVNGNKEIIFQSSIKPCCKKILGETLRSDAWASNVTIKIHCQAKSGYGQMRVKVQIEYQDDSIDEFFLNDKNYLYSCGYIPNGPWASSATILGQTDSYSVKKIKLEMNPIETDMDDRTSSPKETAERCRSPLSVRRQRCRQCEQTNDLIGMGMLIHSSHCLIHSEPCLFLSDH